MVQNLGVTSISTLRLMFGGSRIIPSFPFDRIKVEQPSCFSVKVYDSNKLSLRLSRNWNLKIDGALIRLDASKEEIVSAKLKCSGLVIVFSWLVSIGYVGLLIRSSIEGEATVMVVITIFYLIIMSTMISQVKNHCFRMLSFLSK